MNCLFRVSQIRRFASASSLQKLAVIGAGQMGNGIAMTAIRVTQLPVVLYDVSQKQIEKAIRFNEVLLKKDVEHGKITTQESAAILSRLRTTTMMQDVSTADFVIEAVTENIPLKLSIFAELSKIVRPEVVLATNTSSISITKIAAASNRPDKVIGMHFMNPPALMKLVEIIPGLSTSKATIDTTLELAKRMGKTTTLSNDTPGFITNRILAPYINEACYVLESGIATREDIDTAMKLGTNVPMGPLVLADFIGLDTCFAIMRVLYEGLGDCKYRPCPLLQKYVDAGWLGRKTKRGFYEYD
eukprot:TRINITY_DN7489_c0_g1_i1.p1 TRINITY_DN7489_c0_g1~~TRINITY_DN7489_c0_g1_i1.p1  ORF type:complete len:301 (+),score=58.59 TRINITY_DN7489_c0_g1_i1:67-969(+)